MRALSLIAAALSLALAGPALAQIGQGGGPIAVDSEQLEIRNDQGMAVFSGNALATQGESQLRADRIEVKFERAGEGGRIGSMGAMERVTAIGEVLYQTPEETARADRAVYEIGPNTLVMTGEVVVRQGCDVSTGDRLTVDLATGNTQLDGRREAEEPAGRVRVVLYPEGESDARNDCD